MILLDFMMVSENASKPFGGEKKRDRHVSIREHKSQWSTGSNDRRPLFKSEKCFSFSARQLKQGEA